MALSEVEETGHLMTLEAPERFAQAIMSNYRA
ncbi:MAG: hypothetical protein JWL97_3903 [Gemmatimonadales bacterium]|nr:hypothetical protein [Gemmatimonadales bacterium]